MTSNNRFDNIRNCPADHGDLYSRDAARSRQLLQSRLSLQSIGVLILSENLQKVLPSGEQIRMRG